MSTSRAGSPLSRAALRASAGLLAAGPAALVVVLAAALPALAGSLPGTSVPAGAALSTDRACPPGIGIGLAPLPGGPRSGRDVEYIVAQLAPGQVLNRTVVVCNGTPQARRVSVYSNAATISNGQFLPVGDPLGVDALSSWTRVTPGVVLLGAGQRGRAQVQVSVPAGTGGGQRYAVVYAELSALPGPGLRVNTRVGVREYVYVSGGAAPVTAFTVSTLRAQRTRSGDPQVLAEVHNTGTLAVDLTAALDLRAGPGGVQAGPFPARLGTSLAPGQTEPVTVPLPRALPVGPWQARLLVRAAGTARAVTATLTFPSTAGVVGPPVRARPVPPTRNRTVLIPVAAAVLALVATGLAAFRPRQSGQRRPRPTAAPPAAGVPAGRH